MNKIFTTTQIAAGVFVTLLLVSFFRPGEAQSPGKTTKKQGGTKTILIKPRAYTPPPNSDESKQGEAYYAQVHCAACHSINNDGASIGPMLDGIGSHHDAKFLSARLSDRPDAIATYAKLTKGDVQNLTPHIRLPDNMVKPLVAFLLTLPEPSAGFAVTRHSSELEEVPIVKPDFVPEPKSASSEEGKQLYGKFACARCHQIEQSGGLIGPTLDGIGAFRSKDFLAGQVTDAQAQALTTDKFFELVPTSMPKFKATPEEATKIADYLMTLPSRK
ncbi:MAG: cytochrome c [Candidatus Obscuribacterales bacterium]|nr:cytochrome c [Candidatus Obscuribacterales bacterium]